MPAPKDRAGQVSAPVPVGQDNPPILDITHHHTIRLPTRRVQLSSAQFCSSSPMDIFLETCLELRWLQGVSWALGRGVLPWGKGHIPSPSQD